MTTFVNAMTYYWHEFAFDGEHNMSTSPAPPSRNERMPENTIVCNCTRDSTAEVTDALADTHTHTHTHIYNYNIYKLLQS